MKKKYEVKDGHRVYFCSYKNCRKYANPKYTIVACDRHIQQVLRVEPVNLDPTWFSHVVQEIAEFIHWVISSIIDIFKK